MWEKYHMRNSGVAIKTTMEKMENSLLSEYSIYIGKIEYIYGNTDDDAIYAKLSTKRYTIG